MTLGRTSANKIKIKTDSPKGLRAVECACCATDPCLPGDQYSIPVSKTVVDKWISDQFISCRITGSGSINGTAFNYDSGIFPLPLLYPSNPEFCPYWQGSFNIPATPFPWSGNGRYFSGEVFLRRQNNLCWIEYSAYEGNSKGVLSNIPFDVPASHFQVSSPTWQRAIQTPSATLNGASIGVYGATGLPEGDPQTYYTAMKVEFS